MRGVRGEPELEPGEPDQEEDGQEAEVFEGDLAPVAPAGAGGGTAPKAVARTVDAARTGTAPGPRARTVGTARTGTAPNPRARTAGTARTSTAPDPCTQTVGTARTGTAPDPCTRTVGTARTSTAPNPGRLRAPPAGTGTRDDVRSHLRSPARARACPYALRAAHGATVPS